MNDQNYSQIFQNKIYLEICKVAISTVKNSVIKDAENFIDKFEELKIFKKKVIRGYFEVLQMRINTINELMKKEIDSDQTFVQIDNMASALLDQKLEKNLIAHFKELLIIQIIFNSSNLKQTLEMDIDTILTKGINDICKLRECDFFPSFWQDKLPVEVICNWLEALNPDYSIDEDYIKYSVITKLQIFINEFKQFEERVNSMKPYDTIDFTIKDGIAKEFKNFLNQGQIYNNEFLYYQKNCGIILQRLKDIYDISQYSTFDRHIMDLQYALYKTERTILESKLNVAVAKFDSSDRDQQMSELLKELIGEMANTLNTTLVQLRANNFVTWFNIDYSTGTHWFHGKSFTAVDKVWITNKQTDFFQFVGNIDLTKEYQIASKLLQKFTELIQEIGGDRLKLAEKYEKFIKINGDFENEYNRMNALHYNQVTYDNLDKDTNFKIDVQENTQVYSKYMLESMLSVTEPSEMYAVQIDQLLQFVCNEYELWINGLTQQINEILYKNQNFTDNKIQSSNQLINAIFLNYSSFCDVIMKALIKENRAIKYKERFINFLTKHIVQERYEQFQKLFHCNYQDLDSDLLMKIELQAWVTQKCLKGSATNVAQQEFKQMVPNHKSNVLKSYLQKWIKEDGIVDTQQERCEQLPISFMRGAVDHFAASYAFKIQEA